MQKARLFAGFVLVSLGCLPSFAQEVSAGITGRVTDQTHAAIVGAGITARDLDRGTVWPTKTNDDGIYTFPRIPVGRYEVKVQAAGFDTYVNSQVALEVNQRARVDVTLQIQSSNQTVSVVGEAPLLQTDTTQIGTVVSSNVLLNSPLISQNPVELTLLAAGATTPDPASFTNGLRASGGGRPYVNGNREEANNFLLDGVDNNFTSDNLVAYQPNPDAIEEFKLITNNASAEFGNFQGGIINVVIKSGTNQFHGDAFEFLRNDHLNANTWSNNWSGVPKTPTRYNQFGGTFGGPVFKNRLFFFADYQGLRNASPSSLKVTTVMPAAWRTGDFSNLLVQSTLGKVLQLYNPYSVDPNTGLRAPFPNNQVPQSMLNSISSKLLNTTSLYPLPNNNNSLSLGNYTYSGESELLSDQGDIKLDWKPTDADYFSSRYSNARQDQPASNSFPLFYNSFNIAPFQNGVIDYTHVFGPRLVNEFRFGVNNEMLDNGGADKGLGNIAQNLGIPDAGAGLFYIEGMTTAALGTPNVGTQQMFANTTWHYADNLTLTRGRHMMKMGGQILRQWINVYYAGGYGRTGQMDFSGRFTVQNAVAPAGTMVGDADLLLGLPDLIERGPQTGTWGQRSTVPSLYFQDDWRVTDSLTVNLGLRWEYHTPWVEVDNRQANFNEFTGQEYIAGQPCPFDNCRALYDTFHKDFQPRVGLAWTPNILNKKLVFRAGYTISSYLEGTGTNLRLPMNPPYQGEYAALYNVAGTANELPGSTLTQGFSPITGTDPFAGATIRLWDPNVRPARVQQWNVTSEFQLPQGNVLTLSYVGQHGDELMVPMRYSQKQLVNGTVVPGPYLSGNQALLKDISLISGTCSCGKQKYDALQSTLRRRLAHGLEYQVAFTWSRGMSDAIGYYGQGMEAGSQSAYWENVYNQAAEWGPSYFDEKFNFVPSAVYELPFGHNRQFGSGWNKVLDGVLGGWRLSGVYTWHTGFPLTIKGVDESGTTAPSARPNVIGTPHDQHQIGPGEEYLDISAYQLPALHTFGNAGVGIVRGPGMSLLNISLAKDFHITESKYFEIRSQARNLTNSPVFLSPYSQTITSIYFGQIRGAEAERFVELAAKFYF